ncbi:hypothetical protein M3Y97_00053600 [Aphelenchoides bicaudatus]|nr:hypothetical protein M3Y97_00053600 [Aphelenchoides bicaudatus]
MTTKMVVSAKSAIPQLQTKHNRSFDEKKMQKFVDKRGHHQSGYPPVRNLLAEQEQKPLNQTYTIGSSLRQQNHRPQRSGSMDSEFATDFGPIPSQIAGIFPRSFAGNTSLCRKPPIQCQAITRMLSNQLPLIDNCSPERLCCQRPWSKTQLELAEFKKTLKQIN